MAKPLLDDGLWALIEPVLPPVTVGPQGGRPRLDNRRVLTGILFVLKTGIPWEYLPQKPSENSNFHLIRLSSKWIMAIWIKASLWRVKTS